MEEVKKIVSTENYSRIDKFLASNFPDYSRTYFQEVLSLGHVKVNNKPILRASASVKTGDEVEVLFVNDTLEYELKPQKVDFEVVYSNSDFIIVNKPAGLLVHHASSNSLIQTLTAGLLYFFRELEEFEDKERPGIVHRLDKDTSGLLVVARNLKSRFKLSELFKNRQINKTYLAVVNGHPSREGEINYPIGRHPIHRHKMSHNSLVGKPALTYYKVLAYYENSSLVSVRIVTGRTHQIRVHFAAIGHSLVGDQVYGAKSKHIGRQALHSWKLSFNYLNKDYNFLRPVPDDFKKLLKSVSATS